MKIKILGQGFDTKKSTTAGDQLIKFLRQSDFHTFTAISAFASTTAIKGLSKYIINAKKKFKNLNVIVGVDEKVTSKEALEEILALKINSYIFYQPSATIFHPKIYLFEGNKTSQLIVGSSNLTTRGLFSNIETSILLSLDNNVKTDKQVVQDLKDYFKGIFNGTDPNLKKITKRLIRDLVKANIVQTEAEIKATPYKIGKHESKEIEKLISKIFPKRVTTKIPGEFRKTDKRTDKTKKTTIKEITEHSAKGKLVWTRRKLPASSVQVAETGTNPTGGLRLVQDKFMADGKIIDQTTYFRKTVFGKYSWKQVSDSPYVEVTKVPFEVTVKGKFHGKLNLEIRHKPTGEAGQHNYTTSISWGDLGDTIQKADLQGARLDIYAPGPKGNSFHLIITKQY